VGPAFTVRGAWGRVVATAVHAGHELRPESAARIALDDTTRRREEDPYTDALTAAGDTAVIAHRSRFEVDLNRTRSEAIYRTPDEAWGHSLWTHELPADVVGRSLDTYDAFYATLARGLDELATRGRFVVLDIHSYNHRRAGADEAPAPAAENPEVNVGTGSLDRARWGRLVDRFVAELAASNVDGHQLDVRENVRFRGGHLCRWVNSRYPAAGCALALEFKKTFMDEWTGAVDCGHLEALTDALRAVVPGLTDALDVAP
jgi:N-formylglutamate amidohydrolase